jgi:hypothetical protein
MLLSEKARGTGCVYCVIPTVRHSGKVKTDDMETEKSGVTKGWGRHERETDLYDTLMVNKCPSTFVPTHRLQTTNSEPWGLNLL